MGRWTKNILSGGVIQGTFHIHTCRIDWKPTKRYKNRVSDLILNCTCVKYMYWLCGFSVLGHTFKFMLKSIYYRIKHESRSSTVLYLTMELFFIEINPTVILSYVLFTIKIIIKNPLKLMHVMAWPISSNKSLKN